MMQTSYSTATKYRQDRATHYASTRQAWQHSKPYLELDDCAIAVEDAPSPCPPGNSELVDGIVKRSGVAVVVPSPFISPDVNKRAARFWYQNGFELRESHNSPHFTENYVKEWVRLCDKPLHGKRYSAKAWLEFATRKHKELYCG